MNGTPTPSGAESTPIEVDEGNLEEVTVALKQDNGQISREYKVTFCRCKYRNTGKRSWKMARSGLANSKMVLPPSYCSCIRLRRGCVTLTSRPADREGDERRAA